jgi:hypothetical protein
MKATLFLLPFMATLFALNTDAQTQPTDTLKKNGYVKAGYGNYNNIDVQAGYLFGITPNDKLKADFSLKGMNGTLTDDARNGWNKFEKEGEPERYEWDIKDYSTHATLDYSHAFRKQTLSVGGTLDVRNFDRFYFRKQNFTSYDVHAAFRSTDNGAALQYHAEAAMLKYDRKYYKYSLTDLRETIWSVRGGMELRLPNEWQYVGLNVEVSPTSYGDYGYYYEKNYDPEYYTLKKDLLKGYTPLQLNPYYRLQSGAWSVRAGVHLDACFGYGKKFYASPDVSVSYRFSPNYMLYLEAQGGRRDNDFRRLEALNPYAGGVAEEYYLNEKSYYPYTFSEYSDRYGTYEQKEIYAIQSMLQPYATYEQVNASIGLKASPATGLNIHLYGGYQVLKNDLSTTAASKGTMYDTDYIYMQWTGEWNGGEGEWIIPFPSMKGIASSLMQMDSKNLYLGADISYDYRNLLSFKAKAVYRHWTTKTTKLKMESFKPEQESHTSWGEDRDTFPDTDEGVASQLFLAGKAAFTLDASVTLRPFSFCSLTVGYNHLDRQQPKEKSYITQYEETMSGNYSLYPEYSESFGGYSHSIIWSHLTKEDDSVPGIRNLYAEVSFNLLKDFSLYMRANNLTGRNNQYYPGYPSQTFNFLAGVSARF